MKLVAYANEASLFPWKKKKKKARQHYYYNTQLNLRTVPEYIKFEYHTAAGISDLNDLKYNSQLDKTNYFSIYFSILQTTTKGKHK